MSKSSSKPKPTSKQQRRAGSTVNPGSRPSPKRDTQTGRRPEKAREQKRRLALRPKVACPVSGEGSKGKLVPVDRTIPVPTQHRDNGQRRHTKQLQGALRRLGIAPAQLSSTPAISHILEHAEGGMATVIAALRLSDDPDGIKFLGKLDSVSKTDREYLPLEAICLAAEISPKRLLELAVSSLVEDGRSAGAIVAASFHPRIIRATAQAAFDPLYGHNDRKLFLQGTGFLPQPANKAGGGVFSPVVNVYAQQNVVPESGMELAADRFNAAEDDLKRVHEFIDGDKLLEAPKKVESPANVVLGHQYREMSEQVEELECIPSKR